MLRRSVTGTVWQTLLRAGGTAQCRVAPSRAPFKCGYGVPVEPAAAFDDDPAADVVIVPELWLGPAEDATGLSLISYLQNLRIEEAKRLLEMTDRAVDDISYDVGYEDASFFRRLFRRRTGVAPSPYRRAFKPSART